MYCLLVTEFVALSIHEGVQLRFNVLGWVLQQGDGLVQEDVLELEAVILIQLFGVEEPVGLVGSNRSNYDVR